MNLMPQPACVGNIQNKTEFLPARHVRERYKVSDMTIWRWLRDEQMAFPQPLYLGRQRYWRIADIESWEAAQAAKEVAA